MKISHAEMVENYNTQEQRLVELQQRLDSLSGLIPIRTDNDRDYDAESRATQSPGTKSLVPTSGLTFSKNPAVFSDSVTLVKNGEKQYFSQMRVSTGMGGSRATLQADEEAVNNQGYS